MPGRLKQDERLHQKMDAVRLHCQRVILMIYFIIQPSCRLSWGGIPLPQMDVGYFYRLDSKTKCCLEESPPPIINICSGHVFPKNNSNAKQKFRSQWRFAEGAAGQMQRYLNNKWSSEACCWRTEADWTRGSSRVQMPTRCSHFCTQISHNPGTLNTHSF